MKLLYANDRTCIVNAEYIVKMRLVCNRITPCEKYEVVAETINDGNYVIVNNMTEADAKARLRKIGNYLITDASFLIDFNEE